MKKIASILLTILVLSMFAVFALGSGESKTTVSSGDNQQVEDNKSENNADKKEENKQATVHVGEVLTTDDLKITYVSCEDYTDYNEFLAPKDGYKYIKLTLEVENIGKTDTLISIFDFECYADGVSMDSSYEEDSISATLSSGRKAKGGVYFEVPVDAESIEVEYETDFWSETKAIFVVK